MFGSGQIEDFHIVVKSSTACPTTLLIDPMTTIDPVMQAEVSVSTTGAVTINNGVTTAFKAGTEINLNPDFEVILGGYIQCRD